MSNPLQQTAGGAKSGFLNMPKLPVAGFFARLLALLLDLILIIAGLHLVAKTFEHAIYSIPLWAPYLSATVTFLYFVMLNGPYGRGQTIGKMALRIRVRDYDGGVITWRQAVIRTVVLFPTFVTVPLTALFVHPGVDVWHDFIAGVLTHNLFLGILVATALVIPFNPFRQGLHDYAAKTLVQNADPKEAVTFDQLTEQIGAGWVPFHRQPQYSGLVTVALVVILQAVMMNPGNFTEKQSVFLKNVYALASNPGFEKSAPTYAPIEESLYQAAKQEAEGSDPGATAPTVADDEPSTGPLRLVIQVSRPLSWSVDLATSEGLRLANDYLSEYHEKVIPVFLSYVEDSTDEAAKQRVSSWYGREIEYHLLLVQSVSFVPYPMLMREQSSGVLSFPPIRKFEPEPKE
ncbi:hypothetical protein GC173_07715 [bacterium]|nr:hypothetical protein [bacterium]